MCHHLQDLNLETLSLLLNPSHCTHRNHLTSGELPCELLPGQDLSQDLGAGTSMGENKDLPGPGESSRGDRRLGQCWKPPDSHSDSSCDLPGNGFITSLWHVTASAHIHAKVGKQARNESENHTYCTPQPGLGRLCPYTLPVNAMSFLTC